MGDRRLKSRSLKLNVDGDAVGENALCLKPRRAKIFFDFRYPDIHETLAFFEKEAYELFLFVSSRL